MRRCKATVEFDGGKYCGFQRQPDCDTIEDRINKALTDLLNEPIIITACSRTDSGVHAYGLVFHFDTSMESFPMERLPIALTSYLPSDIVLINAEWVKSDFHARYDVVDKTYEYKILLSARGSAFNYNRAYIYKHAIDVDIMRAAAKKLIGEHDFAAFMATGSGVKTTVRDIKSIELVENGNKISLFITANGFLYNMVRIIVGTLLDIARGHLSIDNIDLMLNSGNRAYGGGTAPAHGLYLVKVNY